MTQALSLRRRGSPLASAEHQKELLEKANGIPFFHQKLDGLAAAHDADIFQITWARLRQTPPLPRGANGRRCRARRPTVSARDRALGVPHRRHHGRRRLPSPRDGGEAPGLPRWSPQPHGAQSPRAGRPRGPSRSQVEVVASLPYWQARQTDARGDISRIDPRAEEAECAGYGQGNGRTLTLVDQSRSCRRGKLSKRTSSASCSVDTGSRSTPSTSIYEHADQPLPGFSRKRELRAFMHHLTTPTTRPQRRACVAPGVHRLGRNALRLRLQSDAGDPRRGGRGPARPRLRSRATRRPPHPDRTALLRLHSRCGVIVRRGDCRRRLTAPA